MLASFENVGVTGVQKRIKLVTKSDAATDKMPYGMWHSNSALRTEINEEF